MSNAYNHSPQFLLFHLFHYYFRLHVSLFISHQFFFCRCFISLSCESNSFHSQQNKRTFSFINEHDVTTSFILNFLFFRCYRCLYGLFPMENIQNFQQESVKFIHLLVCWTKNENRLKLYHWNSSWLNGLSNTTLTSTAHDFWTDLTSMINLHKTGPTSKQKKKRIICKWNNNDFIVICRLCFCHLQKIYHRIILHLRDTFFTRLQDNLSCVRVDYVVDSAYCLRHI